jgi:signal transduction histidine kinase
MRPLTARWIAWCVGIASIVLLLIGLVLFVADRHVPVPESVGTWSVAGIFGLAINLCVPVMGILILDRRPNNRIGWVFLIAGAALATATLGQYYAVHALVARHGELPGGHLAAWISSWSWPIPTVALMFLLLLFPTGSLASRRWRPVAWLAVALLVDLMAASVVYATLIWSRPFAGSNDATGPIANAARVAITVAALLIPLGLLLCFASVVVRFRHAQGDERLQLKWFVAATPILAITFSVGIFFASPLASFVQDLGLLLLFVAIAVAILRYRLYEIDVLIGKTIVYGSLAALITAVYLVVVVAIGAFVGATEGLALLATAIVAIAFQPYRQRAQRVANRIVYGKRATPYEVLSDFSDNVGKVYGDEEVLPRMARLLAEGTGAVSIVAWLLRGDELRAVAWWPGDLRRPAPVRLVGGSLPPFPDASACAPVLHRGDLLGAITVTKPPKESMSSTESKLLSDLAAQVGLVMLNSGLIDELRSSRQRLVAAQDEERRRLERNLHDGAQQQLVALAVRLRLARSLAETNAAKAAPVLEQLEAEAADALETLRDLARGIYPAVLADGGLVAALESQARRSPIRVAIQADGIGRYPADLEAAVYFCVLEALQNAAKYADAPEATVRLDEREGNLVFSVSDHGRGFDPDSTPRGSGLQNMSDRLSALGGGVAVSSRPGAGTTVTGQIPAVPVTPEAVAMESASV